MLTTAEAAAHLNVGARQIRRLLEAGRITGQRVGRDWLIDADSVDDYACNRRRPGRPKQEDNQ